VDEYNDMPKTPQLVCQHLKNISRDALKKYLVVIEETNTGYSGYSPDLEGCV